MSLAHPKWGQIMQWAPQGTQSANKADAERVGRAAREVGEEILRQKLKKMLMRAAKSAFLALLYLVACV